MTDSYADLATSIPFIPETLLSYFFLTLARLLPIVILAPFFGTKNLPRPIRWMFSIALVAIFLPQNLMLAKAALPLSITYVGLLLKELTVGVILAILSTVPFYIAQMAGSIIDHQRGASSLQVTDPTTQSQTGPVGILYNYLLIAIFFSLGGPFLFLDGVATSYQVFPASAFVNPTLFSANSSFVHLVFTLLQYMLTLAIQLSAPALIGVLMTDMFLGIANRLAPQVQIVFLGISLKSWVGLALMTAAWTLILKTMGKESLEWFKKINTLIAS